MSIDIARSETVRLPLFDGRPARNVEAPAGSLLKWIGNKHRSAVEIVRHLPASFGTYYEPFLGGGAVLATLRPMRAVGSDIFSPLMEIWTELKERPDSLKRWYRSRWEAFTRGPRSNRKARYARILSRYNEAPNGADLLFLCRACYGGVVRFRKGDGHMSTPCGIHDPISPGSFDSRVDEWHARTKGVRFASRPFAEAFERAKSGDLIYCDPPYLHTQKILYGAQAFNLEHLLALIREAKGRGIHVALSIDGRKKSGSVQCELPIREGLFESEVFINTGRSMLKRFQRAGATVHDESVSERLLLTY